jgi:hypothetical protein
MQLNFQISANAPSGHIPVSVFVNGNSNQKGVTVSAAPLFPTPGNH